MPEIFREHWKFLLIAWLSFNVISSMPTPAATGGTSTWGYKWAFAVAQTLKGSIPRIAATMFPQAKQIVQDAQPTADTAPKVQ